ncbi:MAG: hypothetical protein IGR76_10110 [Synechococcales cyanobacterium T60_A2020_003]|nr:hypothetical protein [Synechococcales cyanobacterium T60_A2020_003]
MQVERPNAVPLTKEELSDLDSLRALVEKAVNDGILTADENQSIKRCLWKDGKVSPQELEIIQALVWDKVQTGELMYSW